MAQRLKRRVYTPNKPCYELVGDYLESKKSTREGIRLYNPGDDISTNRVLITNTLARRELQRMEKILKSKRLTGKKKIEDLNAQWAELQKSEAEFRRMFIEFNQFIDENENKRERAMKKLAVLRSACASRDTQIRQLEEKGAEIAQVREEMTEKVELYNTYQQFLESVVQEYPFDFLCVTDVLHRYETLKMAKKELQEHQTKQLEYIENFNQKFAKQLKDYSITLSGLETQVAVLRHRHDAAIRECRKWEELYERIRSKATDRQIDIVSIKDSCRQIYLDICRRKDKAPVLEDDCEKQLGVIKKALKDYGCINEMARRAKLEEERASEMACASEKF